MQLKHRREDDVRLRSSQQDDVESKPRLELSQPSSRRATIDDFAISLSASPATLQRFDDALVQLRMATAARSNDEDVKRAAAAGLRGSARPLPHLETIQRSFGQHDVSHTRAFMGPAADEATDSIGARAYAMGNNVVLGNHVSLHTVAHEATHVVQQRHGVSLDSGVGQKGDRYERHADAVADRVASGRSAEELLTQFVGPTPAPASGDVVQGSRAVAVQRNERPLAERVQERWDETQEKGRVFDLLRAQAGAGDELAAVNAVLERIFSGQPADIWLGQTLARYGPEPAWPASAFDQRRAQVGDHDEPGNIRAELTNAQGASVEAFYFPGVTDERVLVIAGTHGTEHAGVEVVQNLLGILRERRTRPRRTVIVIPELFAANVASRERESGGTDPNRNLPVRGSSGLAADAPDTTEGSFHEAASQERTPELGDAVLPENLVLMTLIERFRPGRVVTVHGTQNRRLGGIYYDPQGADDETESERALCERMTGGVRDNQRIQDHAAANEGYDPGHAVAGGPTGVDQDGGTPRPYQWRAAGDGTSMGRWGSGAVTDGPDSSQRAAMSVITIETPGTSRSRRGDMDRRQAANRDSDDLREAGLTSAAAQREVENMALAEAIDQFIINPDEEEARRQAGEPPAPEPLPEPPTATTHPDPS